MGTGNHDQLLVMERQTKLATALYPHTDQGILPSRAVKPAGILGEGHLMRSACTWPCTWPLVVAGRSVIALALVFALVAGSARADDYPNRPVKIIVPFAPGGAASAIPRLLGDWLPRKWGQPVGIGNRTGAAG